MTIGEIVLEVYSLTDTDSTSYPAATMLRRMNAAYEKVVGKLISRNGRWQFDDSNYSSFPIGYCDLVNAQQDYTFDTSHLIIERVEIKDSGGLWQLLRPIDRTQITEAIEEYQKVPGLPQEYDKSGGSLLLYPAPATGSVTMSGGLRVFYQRTASIFTSAEVSTGTKVPGFASPYHMILAYEAAIPYCMSYKPERVVLYQTKSNQLQEELLEFDSNNEKDERKVISMNGIRFR